MKKEDIKPLLTLSLIVILACTVTAVLTYRHYQTPPAFPAAPEPEKKAASSSPPVEDIFTLTPAPTPYVAPASTPLPAAPAAVAAKPGRDRGALRQAAAQNERARTYAPPAQELTISEPLARAALGYVGASPEAEAIWIRAINDASMPTEARKNLIEDLNEDGLSDPKNPTATDLPLIASRIALIEELAPSAMDQANADAFQEAYRDLAEMYARLTGIPMH